jgi:hypothetical protein
LELTLAIGLMSVLAYFAMVSFQSPLARSALPESGRRFRSMIGMVRMRCMMDGKRYRLRFLSEEDPQAEKLTKRELRQPYIEIERDPIEDPGEWTPVLASWVSQEVFLGEVWCYDIRVGEPTFETVAVELEEQDLEEEEARKAEFDLEADEDWVLEFEPNGTSPWMTFRLIDHPQDDFEESTMATYPQLDVILDGRLGAIFLQRPLKEEEIDVLTEHGHTALLRRDFLDTKLLDDDSVLEIDMRGR